MDLNLRTPQRVPFELFGASEKIVATRVRATPIHFLDLAAD
jgi:hypothetical protein